MPNQELLVINSVLENKDVNTLFGESADDLFTAYNDVWDWTKKYYNKYRSIPDPSVVHAEFPDFDVVEVKGEPAHHMEKLRNDFLDARLKTIMKSAAMSLEDESPTRILDKLQRSLTGLTRFTTKSHDTNIMDFDEAERYYDELRERALSMGGTPGIQTGIPFIDSSYTSGLSGGDLIILLGYTGRGKSLLSTLLCCNAYDQGFKPMIVTLEMGAKKVQQRVWTILGSGLFRNSALALGDLPTDNFRTFRNKYSEKGDFITVTNDGIEELRPNILQAKIDQHKPSMLVVDYAQLMSDNAGSTDMTARMRNMSKEFKRLAVANNIPIILISSATPESTASLSEPPMIEQVAWSKQLAYDADLAIAVHKYEDTNIIAVVCRKNRNGDLFAGLLEWDIDNGLIKERFGLNDA